MAKPKNIYELDLHDQFGFGGFVVIRVAGGWLYRMWDIHADEPVPPTTFVPYSEEFKPEENPQ